jgi:peptidoglycan/xylan/chitin deacetylase (PgdA/CDA1 family)
MSKTKPTIFFRNDDVRETLDSSLIMLTELCIQNKVPISHAVEPGNITNEVAAWLNSKKNEHLDLIEIVQHGYNHNLCNPEVKMEFGGNREYHDQLKDIKEGKKIMDKYFHQNWSPVFTFPYGSYNQATLKAINDSGYKAISSKIHYSSKSRIKNLIGRTLGRDMILGKKINYHPGFRKGYNFKEISVSANLIKKYTGYTTADHYSLEEIIGQIMLALKFTNTIGILFHHRFHENHLNLITDLITYLKKDERFHFATFAEMIK